MPDFDDMIKQLVQGREAVIRTARGLFLLPGKVGDEPATELRTQRIQVPGG